MARMARNADGVGAWARGAGRRSPGLLIKEAGLIGASLDPLSKRAGLIGGPRDPLSKNIGLINHFRGDFWALLQAYVHIFVYAGSGSWGRKRRRKHLASQWMYMNKSTTGTQY